MVSGGPDGPADPILGGNGGRPNRRLPVRRVWLVWLGLLAGSGLSQNVNPVLITEAQIVRARHRIEAHRSAKAALEQIVAGADRWRADPVPLPAGRPGFYHDYFCPDHGVALEYSPRSPTRHRCPADGRLLRGPKLDAYWILVTLQNRLQAAMDCALAWRLTGRAAYARSAIQVLVEHARYYRDRVAGRAPRRWMAQSLDEAVLILDAAKAFDLVRDPRSGLSPDDAKLVVQDFLVPTARFLVGEPRNIHNIDCWYNAAILAIAAIADDRTLLEQAIGGTPDSRFGIRDQLREGVSAEGFWKEGSIGYHFYALRALVETLRPALGLGFELESERRTILSMFRAPLAMADGRGFIPPNNDSPPRTLDAYRSLYESGAGMFPEAEDLAGFLARSYGDRWRTSREALLFGPERLPADASDTVLASRSFPESGFAVLRAHPPSFGKDAEIFVMLDFGPHGGYHGHFDKLSLVVHGLGRTVAPDLGTAGYSVPLTKSWYRQTLSHNTLVIDRQSQRPATGRLLDFRGTGPVQHAIASAGEAYPGVAWNRGVFLAEEGYLVVIDRLQSVEPEPARERVFDWVWHAYGTLSLPFPPLRPVEDRSVFGSGDGYEIPNALRSGGTSGPVEARWRIDPDTPTQPAALRPRTSGGLRLWLSAAPRSVVFTATAPGNPVEDRVSTLVVRRRARETTFAAVLEVVPEGRRPIVNRVRPTQNGIELVTRDGTRVVTMPDVQVPNKQDD